MVSVTLYQTSRIHRCVRLRVKVMLFAATFNNISGISWRSALLAEDTVVPGETTDHTLFSKHNTQRRYIHCSPSRTPRFVTYIVHQAEHIDVSHTLFTKQNTQMCHIYCSPNRTHSCVTYIVHQAEYLDVLHT